MATNRNGFQIRGTNFNDLVIASNLGDEIQGRDGNDFLFGRGGHDLVNGGDGHDLVDGGSGNDDVRGGKGNDILLGGKGDDEVKGGKGDDLFIEKLDGGKDTLKGGSGHDTAVLLAGDEADEITVTGIGGRVEVENTTTGSEVELRSIEKILVASGDGNDTVTVNDRAGRLRDIIIDAGAGNDTVTAGDGSQIIIGGDGLDTLTGGAGADIFFYGGDPDQGFARNGSVVGNEDVITDFDVTEDAFALNAADFNVAGGLQFAAIDGQSAQIGNDGFTADTNVIVLVNRDSDGNAETPFNARVAAQQIATAFNDEGIAEAGAGFFIYFNSGLNLNRLVYSENLADGDANLKIVARDVETFDADDLVDSANQAAAKLDLYVEENFILDGSIVGTEAGETLDGDAGNNFIEGLGGDDTLNGGAGDDLIRGGEGSNDVMTGGSGEDGFLFANGDGSGAPSNADQIDDFTVADDRFVLDAASFGLTSDTELAFQNVGRDGDPNDVDSGLDLTGFDATANVYVLQGQFANAGAAAQAIAEARIATVDEQAGLEAGFFAYFNEAQGRVRLFAVEDLDRTDSTTIQQIANLGDTVDAGDTAARDAALEVLTELAVDNFEFDTLINA